MFVEKLKDAYDVIVVGSGFGSLFMVETYRAPLDPCDKPVVSLYEYFQTNLLFILDNSRSRGFWGSCRSRLPVAISRSRNRTRKLRDRRFDGSEGNCWSGSYRKYVAGLSETDPPGFQLDFSSDDG